MKIHHYYHLYCGGRGPWEDIVNEHFQVLESSGLAARLDSYVIGVVGPPRRRQQAFRVLGKYLPNVPFELVCEDEGWEQVTLNELWLSAVEYNGSDAVFYAHTKGAANPSPRQDDWRRQMEAQLIGKWQECVDELQIADIVGTFRVVHDGRARGFAGDGYAQLMSEFTKDFTVCDHSIPSEGNAIFAGNYWWSNMAWIASLDAPKMNDRYDGEVWIGTPNREGAHPAVCNFQTWRHRQ